MCVLTERQSEVLWRWFRLGMSHLPRILRNWFIGCPGTKWHDSVCLSFKAIWMVSIKNVRISMWNIHLVMQSNSIGNKNVTKADAKDPLGFLLMWFAQSVFSCSHLWLKLERLYISVFLLGCMNNADVQRIRFSLDSYKADLERIRRCTSVFQYL